MFADHNVSDIELGAPASTRCNEDTRPYFSGSSLFFNVRRQFRRRSRHFSKEYLKIAHCTYASLVHRRFSAAIQRIRNSIPRLRFARRQETAPLHRSSIFFVLTLQPSLNCLCPNMKRHYAILRVYHDRRFWPSERRKSDVSPDGTFAQ